MDRRRRRPRTHPRPLDDGRALSARWLVDFSFPSRQPAYCDILRERFGDDAIRATANHAKFVMIRNAEWNVVIRTSMNLNLNRRLESYEISDDRDLADWLEVVVREAFASGGASPRPHQEPHNRPSTR